MRAQDVEREGAQAGDDAGPPPDAAGILAERPVTHMMVAVLDAPMAADGRRTGPCFVSVVCAAPCERADSDEDEGPGTMGAGLLLCVSIVLRLVRTATTSAGSRRSPGLTD